MYRENWDAVFPIKKQTMVANRNESGMTGPALRAMIGNVNTMLVAGAMWVTPWKMSSGSTSELRRSWGSMDSVVTRGEISFRSGLFRGTTDSPGHRGNSLDSLDEWEKLRACLSSAFGQDSAGDGRFARNWGRRSSAAGAAWRECCHQL